MPAAVASGGGNADSGPLQPGGNVDDDLDELETLEEAEESLEEADDLEEIPADADANAGSAVRAASPNAAAATTRRGRAHRATRPARTRRDDLTKAPRRTTPAG